MFKIGHLRSLPEAGDYIQTNVEAVRHMQVNVLYVFVWVHNAIL